MKQKLPLNAKREDVIKELATLKEELGSDALLNKIISITMTVRLVDVVNIINGVF